MGWKAGGADSVACDFIQHFSFAAFGLSSLPLLLLWVSFWHYSFQPSRPPRLHLVTCWVLATAAVCADDRSSEAVV